MQIYLARNREQAGPYTLEQVNSMLAAGQVQLSDLAWHDGLDNWQPLGQLTAGRLHYAPPAAGSSPSQTTDLPSASQTSATLNLTKNTPSKVVIAPIASLGKRLLGAVIDNVLTLLAMFPALQQLDFKALENSSGTMADMQAIITQSVSQNSMMLTSGLMLGLLLVQAFLIIIRGQSIGKIVMNTRIVDQTTRIKTGAMNSFVIRTLLINLGYNLPMVGIIVLLVDLGMLLFSDKRISLHDRLASTLVVDAQPEQLPSHNTNQSST